MLPLYQIGLVWLRRDLRTLDHAALALALQRCAQVHCVFVFDTEILTPLPRTDRRVEFIRESLVELDQSLRNLANRPGAGLIVLHGAAAQEIPALARRLEAQAVFSARDYEPQALIRDQAVSQALQAQGVAWEPVKDHVIYEMRELLTQGAKPYSVFTPYLRAWLARLEADSLPRFDVSLAPSALADRPVAYARAVPGLVEIGFQPSNLRQLGIPCGMSGAAQLLEDFFPRLTHYQEWRDFPAIKGPSYLGVHLRFGTISIRSLVRLALQQRAAGDVGAHTWLSELAWRDFYFQILSNFPHVASAAFKPAYDRIAWKTGAHAESLFDAWCEARTGYPLVDAAMLQLQQSGYMHNRLRMVAGSFLVKHLGLDWRRGEHFFAQHLNDFDLAANNGGWQWVSSSGCDAQPYFRIFNPVRQSQNFDPQGKFIRRYLPALKNLSDKDIHAPWLAKPQNLQAAGVTLGENYPLPVVDHATARAATLQRYGAVSFSAQ
jgi:deoxyribodipyrimidine photo-lyase